MTRIDHTRHGHPATPAGRKACRDAENAVYAWLGTFAVAYEKDIVAAFSVTYREAGDIMEGLLRRSDVAEVRGGVVRDV